jgi:GR25 family glycosyltransferase involved in LPS biosynthesis
VEWIKKLDAIFVLNLDSREDRLLEVTEQFDKYEIPFTRVTAIPHYNGAEGLRLTMIKLFEDCIEKEMQNVLVFEDDVLIVCEKELFHNTMDAALSQLSPQYIMLFLGCQITASVSHFFSPNIIVAGKMFSTHAVLYSLRGMREILAHQIAAPIDNFYVSEIEPMGYSFATYPLLCSQREGYSDIGKAEISWRPFIEQRYQQKVNEMTRR